MNLNRLIEVLKENRSFDIIDVMTSDSDLFFNLQNFEKEEYIDQINNEIEKNFKNEEFENIIYNLLKLYPLTNKILKKILNNQKLEEKRKYYIFKKNEIEKKIEEKDIDKKIKNIKEQYSEDYLNKKKIELQQKKENFDKRKKELNKLEEEIEKLKKEEMNA